MIRRLVVLAALIAYAGTAWGTPAYAAVHVICVGTPTGHCDEHRTTIPLALGAAAADGVADTVLVGPGTYADGPYSFDGTSEGLVLKGSGQGVTVLTAPASATAQAVVTAQRATVEDLTIRLTATQSTGDSGLSLKQQATGTRVTVVGPGTEGATGVVGRSGSSAGHVTVQLPVGVENTGASGSGGFTVSDSTFSADYGFVHSGSATDTVSRDSFRVVGLGIATDDGAVHVDDTVIDLGTSPKAQGIRVANDNNSTAAKSVNANHVTIVGGGPGSYGLYVWAATPTALQQSSATLNDSIVRGPAVDLYAAATNDGSQSGTSTASIITTYSDWHSASHLSLPHGSATIGIGAGHLDVVPGFRDAAHGDYRLSALSPLVDHGSPGADPPTTDRDGHARVQDGDRNGTKVRDMGAYENAPDFIAPRTSITHRPATRVTTRRVRFSFVSNEPGSTFRCRLDTKAWKPCSSPNTFAVGKGWHTFRVRARDHFGNVDKTPAAVRFRRVR